MQFLLRLFKAVFSSGFYAHLSCIPYHSLWRIAQTLIVFLCKFLLFSWEPSWCRKSLSLRIFFILHKIKRYKGNVWKLVQLCLAGILMVYFHKKIFVKYKYLQLYNGVPNVMVQTETSVRLFYLNLFASGCMKLKNALRTIK